MKNSGEEHADRFAEVDQARALRALQDAPRLPYVGLHRFDGAISSACKILRNCPVSTSGTVLRFLP